MYSDYPAYAEVHSDIRYIYIFTSIAVLILLIACVNYMNMATARSLHRAREVGIRKVFGSRRSQLITQFFSEAILLSTLAAGFALILVELLLTTFNTLVRKQLS